MDNRFLLVKGTEILEKKMDLNPIPEINGQVNTECYGGLVHTNAAGTVTIRNGHIGPDGYLASHKAETNAYVTICEGDGKIGICDNLGNSILEMYVKAGDEVIFEYPMELHYYIAGKDGMSYRVVGY